MEEEKKEDTVIEQPGGLVDKAEAAALRIEAALKKQEEMLERQEKLMALQRLGGRTDGAAQMEKPKELTPQELAKKVMEGEINPFTATTYL